MNIGQNTTTLETQSNDNTFVKEAIQCEIGEKLRFSREEQGLSIDHVIKELKFSKTFLEGLEQGDWSLLPGEVYAIGFLKQYAQLLHLDLNTQIEKVKSTTLDLTTPLTYPDAAISPSKKWGFISIALFLVLILMVNLFSDDDHIIKKAQLSSPIKIKGEKDLIVNVSNNENISISDIYTETLERDLNLKQKNQILIKKSYSFYAATNDVWLQIFEVVDNEEPLLIKEALLKKGQSFSIIDTHEKLLLTAGNPQALEVLEGDKVLFSSGTLGKPNRILKKFLLNP